MSKKNGPISSPWRQKAAAPTGIALVLQQMEMCLLVLRSPESYQLLSSECATSLPQVVSLITSHFGPVDLSSSSFGSREEREGKNLLSRSANFHRPNLQER
jgi:hypothetical protein